MSIRLAGFRALKGAIVATVLAAFSHEASAETNILKECGTRYQAAKDSDALNGMSWRDFLESCRPPPDRKAKVASFEGVTAPSNGVQPDVLKRCAAQFQTAKETNGPDGLSWADFFKSCRTRVAEQSAARESRVAAPRPVVAPSKATPAPAAAPVVAAPESAEPAPIASPSAPVAGPADSVAPITSPQPIEAHGSTIGNKARTPVGLPISDALMREKLRQKKCAAQWKAQKSELRKVDPTANWPKYWSECERQLKMSGS